VKNSSNIRANPEISVCFIYVLSTVYGPQWLQGSYSLTFLSLSVIVYQVVYGRVDSYGHHIADGEFGPVSNTMAGLQTIIRTDCIMNRIVDEMSDKCKVMNCYLLNIHLKKLYAFSQPLICATYTKFVRI
jgi:hypothetical protein